MPPDPAGHRRTTDAADPRTADEDETQLFVATVAVSYRRSANGPDVPSPGRIADTLMRIPRVVTVRVDGDAATAVYRVDVAAATRAEAECGASVPAVVAGDELEVELEVSSVTSVVDSERIAAFLRMAEPPEA